MIGILDADIGNLRSASNAIDSLGFDYRLVTEPTQFDAATHLIIPGVGSYFTAIQHIESRNLRGAILDFATSGRPLLGICLGMQILSDVGEEIQPSTGLGLIPGAVKALPAGSNVMIPHVGWNSVSIQGSHPVLRGLKTDVDFYFVHSYYFECPVSHILATTEYGTQFCSIIGKDNVIGVQFHPEKSQVNGLKLLQQFCEWDGRC